LIARTVKSEKEWRMTFYNMMTVEGLITMAWAGGAMVLFGKGTPIPTNATLMVGIVSRDFLGNFGGILAIIGVIVLPITTGDTALRGLRLIVTELIGMKDNSSAKRLGLSFILFIPVAAILYFAKTSPSGFSILWRYFAFTNQFMGIFCTGHYFHLSLQPR
jgi:carbon starvation protein CstA